MSTDGVGVGGASAGNNSGLVQTLEGGVVTKRSSRIAGLSRKDEGESSKMRYCIFNVDTMYVVSAVAVPSTSRVAMESPISSEMNEESDPDMDFLEEYDSEEDRRSSRRKRKVYLCSSRTFCEYSLSPASLASQGYRNSSTTHQRTGERKATHVSSVSPQIQDQCLIEGTHHTVSSWRDYNTSASSATSCCCACSCYNNTATTI